MAKCVLCNSRKGQRQCKVKERLVCSLCCGQHRQAEQCRGCAYYRDAKPVLRNYAMPRFSPEIMRDDLYLQSISYVIESTLCLWDRSLEYSLNDESALKVLEALLDRYHFKETVEISDEPIRTGYEMVLDAIEGDLPDATEETLIKILGAIYYVARRRARGGRDYFELIHQYITLQAAPGVPGI